MLRIKFYEVEKLDARASEHIFEIITSLKAEGDARG